MSAPATSTKTRVVPGTDFRLLLHQVLDALERGSTAAEMLAAHGIIKSMTFDVLCNALGEALEKASVIEAAMQRRPTLVFRPRSWRRISARCTRSMAGAAMGSTSMAPGGRRSQSTF